MRSWGLKGTVFFGEDEKVLKVDDGDGCTTVNVIHATELYTWK